MENETKQPQDINQSQQPGIGSHQTVIHLNNVHQSSNGLCIASFVLALIGALVSVWFLAIPPIYLAIAIPFAALAFILGLTGLSAAKRKGEGRALGVWGVVLSSIGIFICIGEFIAMIFFVGVVATSAHTVNKQLDKIEAETNQDMKETDFDVPKPLDSQNEDQSEADHSAL